MAIKIEQLDINNISKFFMLRAEMEKAYGKEYIMSILSSLTVDEKRDLGLGYFPYEYNRLQELIQLVENILQNSEIGDKPGQYPQEAHDALQNSLQIVKSESTNKSLEEIANLTDILRDALTEFLSKANTEDNYEFGDKSYGYTKPVDPSKEWIAGKIIDDIWISLEPLPEEHPNYQDYTHYIGLYVDGIVFSRHPLPPQLQYLQRIDGAVWDNKWFSMYEEYNRMISLYLGTLVAWIPSSYIEVDASKVNFLNSDGKVNVWWGREYLQHFLPTSIDILTNIFNVVNTMGMNNIPSNDTQVVSVDYLTDNMNKLLAFVPEGTTVSELTENLILATGTTLRFFDPVTLADLNPNDVVVETTRLIITSKDGTVKDGYIVDITKPEGV